MENIVDTSGCLSMEELTAYHKDQLDNDKAHLVEQHLVDCEMCSDTLEMIAEHGSEKINHINDKVAKRVDLSTERKHEQNWINMAAAVVLLITVGGGYVYLNSSTDGAAMAEIKQEQPVEIIFGETIPVESVTTNEETPIKVIHRIEERLILQVATIDADDNIEYYDSTINEINIDEPNELAIVNTIEPFVMDSVVEKVSIIGSSSINAPVRKKRRTKGGYAYGAEDNGNAVAYFPGGDKELKNYLTAVAKKMTKLKGEVEVIFDLDTNGKIGRSKVKKSTNKDLNEFAIKILDEMPKWNPATKNGKSIGSRQKLIMIF